MDVFMPGQKVRQKGMRQIMEVVGAAGLGSLGIRAKVVINGTLRGKTVCTWVERGRRKQRVFNSAALEHMANE